MWLFPGWRLYNQSHILFDIPLGKLRLLLLSAQLSNVEVDMGQLQSRERDNTICRSWRARCVCRVEVNAGAGEAARQFKSLPVNKALWGSRYRQLANKEVGADIMLEKWKQIWPIVWSINMSFVCNDQPMVEAVFSLTMYDILSSPLRILSQGKKEQYIYNN